MDFLTQFKINFILCQSVGDDFCELFSPMFDKCSKCYDSGDIETATQMLSFISRKMLVALKAVGICV